MVLDHVSVCVWMCEWIGCSCALGRAVSARLYTQAIGKRAITLARPTGREAKRKQASRRVADRKGGDEDSFISVQGDGADALRGSGSWQTCQADM